MYFVQKRIEVSASHKLSLSYKSKCSSLHGHNWIITIFCKSDHLNADGMVVDFTHLKQQVHDYLDHNNLNEILPFNPTAENMAKWIAGTIGNKCYRVEIQESEGNIAAWER